MLGTIHISVYYIPVTIASYRLNQPIHHSKGRSFLETRERVSTPIIEFVNDNHVVSTLNVTLSERGNTIIIDLDVVPSTRVGRPLPDWPKALSLRGDPDQRRN